MKRKLYLLFMLVILVFSLVGCAKVISEEEIQVKAEVIDVYYKPAWNQPVFNGKTTTIIHHSAQYKVTLEYEGEEYFLRSYSAYLKCKSSIGEYVDCNFRIVKYDNGNVNKYISCILEE